ncbi:ferritin-like fold-containing protein [Micromonospora sp. CNB394]|uniref:ferritin-like fold-containing protein n=1 Tax=Micromonospora sp. CNB394 TaxID=1169151 RepID=UPI00035FA1F5|nr:ferritin-like fold-containing protein [Micromonospora sp. CNB394]
MSAPEALPDPAAADLFGLVAHGEPLAFDRLAAAEIRAAIEVDPRTAGRLSMWVRRLLGEALSQAGRAAGARSSR